MEQIGLWNWENEYYNLALNGYSWDVKIEIGNYSIESQGLTNVPESSMEFLKALKELTGQNCKF